MNKVSRRAIARYAAEQLQKGEDAGQLAKQLASLMVETGLTDQTDFLIGDIAWELEQRGQLSAASVTIAHPLSNELKTALKDRLKKAINVGQVLIEENVDKSVLGGIRIETPGHVWDATVSQKLKNLREAF
jgi:F0F1-type ATP synthase delta subunit